jgi:hypothetical protein
VAGFFLALAVTAHAATAVLLLGLIGLADGFTDVLFATVVQREAHPQYYGRVFGFASAFMATTMMGAVVAAPLMNRIGTPQTVILLAGVTTLAAAAITLVGTWPTRLKSANEAGAAEQVAGVPAFARSPAGPRDG